MELKAELVAAMETIETSIPMLRFQRTFEISRLKYVAEVEARRVSALIGSEFAPALGRRAAGSLMIRLNGAAREA